MDISKTSNVANDQNKKHFTEFPFEPYPIQLQFMQALYETIEKRQIGFFESPTGTVDQKNNK